MGLYEILLNKTKEKENRPLIWYNVEHRLQNKQETLLN